MFSEKEGSRSNSPMLEGSTTEDPMKDNELEESTTNSVLPADYRPQVAPERYAWICESLILPPVMARAPSAILLLEKPCH